MRKLFTIENLCRVKNLPVFRSCGIRARMTALQDGKRSEVRKRIQELEEIYHNIQAKNAKLRRLLQVAEEEKQDIQEIS
jgi:hypothetical protein